MNDDFKLDEVIKAKDVSLDKYTGEILPEKTDKIALIDADTVAYIACLNSQETVELLPEFAYTDYEWEQHINNPTYDEEAGTIRVANLDAGIINAKEKIDKILARTGCKTCELHFSSGKENFRYKMYADYKGNRNAKDVPAGLKEMKEKLCELYKGTIHTKWEADDIVVFLKKEHYDKYVLCAIDKDVYNSIPGKHFNYFECDYIHASGKQVKKDMQWIEVSDEEAYLWPYIQCLIGDTSDNIKGAYRVGIKNAAVKKLDANMTEAELWEVIEDTYEKKNGDKFEAILTMNLVNMHLLERNDEGEIYVKRWKPTRV